MTDRISLDEFLLKYPVGKVVHKDTHSVQYSYTAEASYEVGDILLRTGNRRGIMKDVVKTCLCHLEESVKKAKEDFERVV
jgi:hypothetical protein